MALKENHVFKTLPNKITLSRIILSPVFFIFFYLYMFFSANRLVFLSVCWILFLYLEISDMLDGFLARKLNKISDFGKIFDPFADRISRLTYFFCFLLAGIMPLWILLILVYREISISFIRYMAYQKKMVMAARLTGKIKAFVYAVSGFVGLFNITINSLMSSLNLAVYSDMINVTTIICFSLCAVIAIISLIDYGLVLRKL